MDRPKRARSYRTHINLAPMPFAVRQAFIKEVLAVGDQAREVRDSGLQLIVSITDDPRAHAAIFCEGDLDAAYPAAMCLPPVERSAAIARGLNCGIHHPIASRRVLANHAPQTLAPGPGP